MILAAMVAVGIGLGIASTGGGVLVPLSGTAALVLYGAAIAGIGLAVAGVWRSSAAGIACLVVAAGTLLLDVVAPALKLPDWVHSLALTAHFGEPLLGNWNPIGVAISLALGVGGVALGDSGGETSGARPGALPTARRPARSKRTAHARLSI